MMEWICMDCQREFEEPIMVKEGFSHAFGREEWIQPECPFCQSADIEHPHYCPMPSCTNGMRSGEKLCTSCRAKLLEKIDAFFDELTEAEEQQFDDWYEVFGSIKYRKEWNGNDH